MIRLKTHQKKLASHMVNNSIVFIARMCPRGACRRRKVAFSIQFSCSTITSLRLNCVRYECSESSTLSAQLFVSHFLFLFTNLRVAECFPLKIATDGTWAGSKQVSQDASQLLRLHLSSPRLKTELRPRQRPNFSMRQQIQN